MDTRAKLNYLRISPRKVRLVADLIRGQDVVLAERQLAVTTKRSAKSLLKLLRSATSNAASNHQLDRGNLFIKEICVDSGPTLKRWRARAFGRAAEIKKRTCHVRLTLSEREPGKAVATAGTAKGKAALSQSSRKARQVRFDRPATKRAGRSQLKKGLKNIGSKMFRRKSI